MARSHSTRLRFAGMVMALLMAAAGFAGAYVWWSNTERQLFVRTRRALAANDVRGAVRLAGKLVAANPESVDGLRCAAEAFHRAGLHDAAREYLESLEARDALFASEYLTLANLALLEGGVSRGEAYLVRGLAKDANYHPVRQRLIHLLSIQCRMQEARMHRQYLLRRRVWTTEDLQYLAKPDDLMQSPDLDVFLAAEPRNPHLLVAKARHARLLRRHDEAEEWLEKALAAHPGFPPALADQGLLLWERRLSAPAFVDWHKALTGGADEQPDVWYVRGLWAKSREDSRGASRCFLESLRRAPDDRRAAHQLSLVLAALGDDDMAREWSSRVSLLDELNRAVDDIYDASSVNAYWRRAAELLTDLGRLHEAAAWYYTIGGRTGDSSLTRRAEQLFAEAEATVSPGGSAVDLLSRSDVIGFPLPNFLSGVSARDTEVGPSSRIRFTDVARESELDFQFLGAELPVRRPRRLFEIFGAGVGVIDFDLDGWPDIYAAQGSPRSSPADNANYRDQLFWNRSGTRFQRITDDALLGDDRFSFGVATGDFDNDGFPDLYVANLGENRLYRNSGDGTFQEIAASSGVTGESWTVSCAMADLNGDGFPDLYDVTYLRGREIFETICDDPAAAPPRSCRPRDFLSAPDRFFLSRGDGTFRECAAAVGFQAADGKGLGLVVADFLGDGRLSAFIANDTTANHFYCSRSPRGAAPVFENRADLAGLAFDRDGLSQACMGVAADDVDADGNLDLFVTNFFEEANTLYRQWSPGSFMDASRETGLYAPSLPMLGFGTQFVDADLDGDPDLVVANGHITSENRDGSAFQMRPQFFENHGGQFLERAGTDIGGYFDRSLLGRAMARLDLDRNGREDLAITHLDAPLALLRNDSPDPGRWLSLRLVGVACERDAIGATVTVVTSEGLRRTRQVTAGDGYACSNARSLVFGLGDAKAVERATVRWPTGVEQHLAGLPLDREYLVIEGREMAIELPR